MFKEKTELRKIARILGVEYNKEKMNKKTHLFDKICEIYNIEHRLTKPYHPQTNGMVERMNRKRKECFTSQI